MAIQKTASGTSYTFPLKSLLLPKNPWRNPSKDLANKTVSGNAFGQFSIRHFMFSCINREYEVIFFFYKSHYLLYNNIKVLFPLCSNSISIFLSSKLLANTTLLDTQFSLSLNPFCFLKQGFNNKINSNEELPI